MRRILTTTALLLAFFIASAQENSSKFTRIYGFASGAASFSGGFSGELGGRAVLKDKWCFSAGHFASAINAETPGDFSPDVFTGFVMIFSGGKLRNESGFTYLAAGRYFGKGTGVGGFVELGAGLSNGYYWSFERDATMILGGNYTTKQIDDNGFGALVRAGVDCPVTSWFGLGFDFFYNYNSGQLSDNVGLGMRLMFGKTGKQKK